ncbi:uncharacterized protein LOC124677193 [Lolium rigidum]|uniref:uncharacterized protein LOC124677193 n=1 Tax=Lolium rigidum TaxID=89674 RepID=UPI001F5C105E|nr:uncharacterized protein LOC124677193 [Lolium rigidum]
MAGDHHGRPLPPPDRTDTASPANDDATVSIAGDRRRQQIGLVLHRRRAMPPPRRGRRNIERRCQVVCDLRKKLWIKPHEIDIGYAVRAQSAGAGASSSQGGGYHR